MEIAKPGRAPRRINCWAARFRNGLAEGRFTGDLDEEKTVRGRDAVHLVDYGSRRSYVLEHVAAGNQVEATRGAFVQAAEGFDSVRGLDAGDVIDAGRGTWDQAIEQASSVASEIEDGFHRGRDMVAKNCGQGKAAIRQRSRGEHAAG